MSISPLYQPEQAFSLARQSPGTQQGVALFCSLTSIFVPSWGASFISRSYLVYLFSFPSSPDVFVGTQKTLTRDDSKPRRAAGGIISWEALGKRRGKSASPTWEAISCGGRGRCAYQPLSVHCCSMATTEEGGAIQLSYTNLSEAAWLTIYTSGFRSRKSNTTRYQTRDHKLLLPVVSSHISRSAIFHVLESESHVRYGMEGSELNNFQKLGISNTLGKKHTRNLPQSFQNLGTNSSKLFRSFIFSKFWNFTLGSIFGGRLFPENMALLLRLHYTRLFPDPRFLLSVL